MPRCGGAGDRWTFGCGAKTSSQGGAAGELETLQPKVLLYDDRGRPVTRQEEREEAGRATEVFAWSTFMQTSTVVESLQDSCQKGLILSHLQLLHSLLPAVTEADLKVVKNDIQGGGVRVVALKAMQAGALRMAPILPGASIQARLQKQPNASYVLRIRLSRSGDITDWYLIGGGSLPSASAVVDGGKGVVQQHAWQPGHFPWPLWLVKRVPDVSQANCAFQDMDVRSVSTFGLSTVAEGEEGAFADNCDITIPVLVNTAVLAQGDELKVRWAPLPSAPREARAPVNWTTQARKQLRKAKQQ